MVLHERVNSYMFQEILLRTSNLQKCFLLNWYGGRIGINFHKFYKQYRLIVLSQDWTVSKSDDKLHLCYIQRDICDSLSGKGFRRQCKCDQSWHCVRYWGYPKNPVVILQSPTLRALHYCLVLCAHPSHDQHFSRSPQPLCGGNRNLLWNVL